jgi:molybdate transport system ATP-binding protein
VEILHLRNLNKLIIINFEKKLKGVNGNFTLVINEHIKQGDFITLFGDSGVGKSSILNILAGLLTPEKGEIIVNNRIWFSSFKKINLPPQKREIGFLFQDYALFPNMTIEENLIYALQNRKDKTKVNKILELTELTNLKKEKPYKLSGGQKQRVALARAIIREPKLLLLDEPFSALDFKIKTKLQKELIKIHKNFNLTTIMVSHDIGEAFSLSSSILKIENGKIVEKNSPKKTLELVKKSFPNFSQKQDSLLNNLLHFLQRNLFYGH